MTELSREELIGAYLDGELSPEERARAEQLLAESEESRQMLEELRALRARVQALPRHSLPADFSQRVLQRAEREMILGSTVPAGPREAVARREPPARDTLPFGGRWVRPLVYAGFAAAAALLIAVFLPNETQQERNVASLPQHDTELHPAPAESALAVHNDDRRPSVSDMQKSAEGMPQAGHSAPAIRGESTVAGRKEAHDMAPAATPAPASEPGGRSGAADDLLIVDLQVVRTALARGEFEQLLRSAEIQVAEEPQAVAAANPDAAEEADFGKNLAGAKAKPFGETALPANAELFYVEATAEQLEALLATIDEKNEDFPALLVEPAASQKEQTQWRMRFRRIPASAQVEVAEEELSGDVRERIARIMSTAPALADVAAADESAASTARRINVAADSPTVAATPAASKLAADGARNRADTSRVRAVFVLRVVADPVPPPTLPAEGVE